VSSKPELAVLGGSFDPPHVGHVLLAAYVLATTTVERVIIAPVCVHSLGKQLTDFAHRLRMCELAFADLARIEVSTLERELGGVSRTLRLLQALSARHPDHQLRLVIGADILSETDRWHAFDEVKALAPLLVVGRAGFTPPQLYPEVLALPEVSSSALRQKLAQGRPVSHELPARVLAYIHEHGLYESASPP
jgi:nicotinate-nucleotide adenylyltransferase